MYDCFLYAPPQLPPARPNTEIKYAIALLDDPLHDTPRVTKLDVGGWRTAL
jgi:hypothetical protein